MEHEQQLALGMEFSSFDVRDYKAVSTIEEFPEEFELPMVRVKNQGKVNSCCAHVLSSVVEYFNYTQLDKRTEMSVGYIYGNRENTSHKSNGMILRDALNNLRLYGDVEKKYFPYNIETPEVIDRFKNQSEELYDKGYPYRISAYYKVKTKEEIKAALKSGYPIPIGVLWYSDMEVKDGILTTNYKDCKGGHCMLIYGWNEKGWKVQNSWGRSWGISGTCIIPYDMKLHEAWAVVDTIKEGIEIKKPFSSDTGKYIAKIINFIFNLIYEFYKKKQ